MRREYDNSLMRACDLTAGAISETGKGKGAGTTINVPLPPGSGSGAYRAVFDRIIVPALDAFNPQLILVSSGFDASFYDPLAAQMCTSEDYRWAAVSANLNTWCDSVVRVVCTTNRHRVQPAAKGVMCAACVACARISTRILQRMSTMCIAYLVSYL